MSPLISLQDVGVEINHQKILSQISLTINANEITTILGPNGAGKSTLIKVVLGLMSPTTGTVTRAPNLTIGYVPQSINFNPALPITVGRFMHLNRQLTKSAVKQILALVKADHLIDEAMQQLSGGELQRVLLAQAIAKQPQLLILDEPAQGVDVNGQVLLYDLIANTRVQLKCGVLMVSHDLDLVMKNANKIICLNHTICCTGTPAAVANDPAFMTLFNRGAK
ncbi:ATP-binding cassette domain-containing protein [Orbaceae bacterium ESL0727]|nr:ATP-binding cassette domain-containing protein [Orbaceae bacterium ESL0727]